MTVVRKTPHVARPCFAWNTRRNEDSTRLMRKPLLSLNAFSIMSVETKPDLAQASIIFGLCPFHFKKVIWFFPSTVFTVGKLDCTAQFNFSRPLFWTNQRFSLTFVYLYIFALCGVYIYAACMHIYRLSICCFGTKNNAKSLWDVSEDQHSNVTLFCECWRRLWTERRNNSPNKPPVLIWLKWTKVYDFDQSVEVKRCWSGVIGGVVCLLHVNNARCLHQSLSSFTAHCWIPNHLQTLHALFFLKQALRSQTFLI